jgi:aspartate kinase
MIVMKFGGTSVESAVAIERVAGIVRARLDRHPVVVVSAMGETTNRLLAIADRAVSGDRQEAFRELEALREYHLRESGMEQTVGEHFQELGELVRGLAVLGELTPRSVDVISSFGERLSSLIVTRLFEQSGISAIHLDARSVIVTDNRHTQAVPLFTETYARLAATIPPLAAERVVVMAGFIGATEEGVPSTLGRGGSDFTAAIVGAGIGAEEIQIWTDVDGMLTADPRLLAGGHRVRACSFAEAAELAYFGAKVLHPATVLPAEEKGIPVLILNSRRPEAEGTRIVPRAVPSTNVVKSIACKSDITVVNIHSLRMLMAHGFLRRVFEIFDRYETPVDMIATSEVSISLTVDDPRRLDAIRAELVQFCDVSAEGGNSIICLVGENIRDTPGVAARMFQALDGVNIRMLSQGASQLNVSFVVATEDVRRAVELLHREFFTELDPEVFER